MIDHDDIPEQYRKYIQENDMDGLLLELYTHKEVDWFQWVYLHCECKFPVDEIVRMVDLVNEKSSKTCRMNWRSGELECIKMYITDEVREKYGDEIRMIQFMVDMRKYSVCKLVMNGKFYYTFDRKRYLHRVNDFL